MIDGSAKGPCGPKTGQKVVFLEGERGPKIPFQKGFLTPKQGSKGQKGYPAPPWKYTVARLFPDHGNHGHFTYWCDILNVSNN